MSQEKDIGRMDGKLDIIICDVKDIKKEMNAQWQRIDEHSVDIAKIKQTANVLKWITGSGFGAGVFMWFQQHFFGKN